MATIPRIVAGRSLDPGGVVSYPQGDPVGQALEQAGTKGQALVTHYQNRVDQQERFQSLISFDGFSNSLVGDTEQAKQTMQPGALGLHDKLLETYDKRSQEWLSTIPESQRPEFDARIKAKREQFSVGAARLEKDESDRFQVDGITKRLDTAKSGVLQSGPEAVGAFQKDVEELIDSSTLTPIDKQKAKDTVKADLASTGFLALAKRDPEEAQRVAKGWGVDKGFSGTAIDRTMQLLRDKEGFKSSTYWDVNADRVGYGSDTITAPDGSVRTVKRGDTVTRADAERDLQRRTAESLDSVRKSVGDEAFSRLTPNQQAALGSVTYNYGKLPDNIAAAVRTGDAGAIASSIEARQNDNNGVNKNRRLSEAALARSSGDGPVQGVYQPDARFDGVPADKRLQLAGMADLEQHKRDLAAAAVQTQDYNNRLNSLQTAIIDNNATLADVQKARQDGWLKDAGDIQKLHSQIASRDKGMSDGVNFGKAIADPNFAWNPVDKDQKDWADAGFKTLGGNMQALQAVAEKTGIVPASAGVALKGALFSPNAQTVQNALQTSANLVGGKYPDIFASVTDGKQLTDAALTFRHYVYDRGMTAADATKRIMEERTPEYQQKVTAKIKSEDMNAIVKKELKDGDIRSAFDPSFLGLAPNPQLTFNPEMRVRAMGDYEEIFREKFAANGDVSLSKKLALEEMKTTWGVTSVSGTKTVMKYPPERSTVYAGIENPSEHIAMQAVSAIREWNFPAANLTAADQSMKLNPQEKALYQRHLTNLTGAGGVDNADGSRSTIFASTFGIGDKTYVIPTVWNGKILPPDEALNRARAEGLDKFPSYGSEGEAKARYDQLHGFMESDTALLKSGKADVDRSKIRIDEVRNTGERYMRGEPPVYSLTYQDKNGHWQTIPKQFYADPAAMRDTQTAGRAAQSAKINEVAGIKAENIDLSRANFGVQ